MRLQDPSASLAQPRSVLLKAVEKGVIAGAGFDVTAELSNIATAGAADAYRAKHKSNPTSHLLKHGAHRGLDRSLMQWQNR